MRIYKQSKEEFSVSKPLTRFGKLKWWFLLLMILGVVALVSVVLLQGERAAIEIQKVSFHLSPASVAYAQEPAVSDPAGFTPRVIIISGVFVVLGLVYLAGIFKLFFTANADQVDTAADLVKTLTGFFVGAATGFLG